MCAWTIEAEILKISRDDSLEAALRRSGVLQEQEDFIRINENANWRRGGAETFVYDFSVVGSIQETRLFAKALVSMTLGVSPDDQLTNWLNRRASLESAGCVVPRLFFSGKAMLIEQHLYHALETALSGRDCLQLTRRAAKVATSVVEAGFQPITFIPNMREHQNNVYWVDFGHDLGASSQHYCPASAIMPFYTELEKWVDRDTISSILSLQ